MYCLPLNVLYDISDCLSSILSYITYFFHFLVRFLILSNMFSICYNNSSILLHI
nr:MAG TPA: hypothetical protein [Caudoviricetes sp.]